MASSRSLCVALRPTEVASSSIGRTFNGMGSSGKALPSGHAHVSCALCTQALRSKFVLLHASLRHAILSVMKIMRQTCLLR